MVTAADRAELAQFIGTAVLPGTLRVYGSHWELWKHFLEVHGAGTDAYLRGLPESEKAALVGLFIYRRYQEGARGKAATGVTAGIRMHYVQQLESSTFLDSAVVATARKACKRNPEELRAIHDAGRSESVKLPICEDILDAMRKRLWDRRSWTGSDLGSRMVYLASVYAFDQTARISEYTKAEQGRQDHCVRLDDLTFGLRTGGSVRGSGLLCVLAGDSPEGAVQIGDVTECNIRTVTTKGKEVAKSKLISRSSEEESRFLEDLITFIIKSGIHGADELFSYRAPGRDKVVLRARTVRDELKRECELHGLPANYFSSHSFRKGGVTHMSTAGTSELERRERTGHASGSLLLSSVYDYAPGKGPLAANSIAGGHKFSLQDIKKLVPAARGPVKAARRQPGIGARRRAPARRARRVGTKGTQPPVVMGRGASDPRSGPVPVTEINSSV